MDEVLDPLSGPLEEEERLPSELVAELRRGEFFGLTIPKSTAGKGWTAVKWFSVLEELSRGYATVRHGRPHHERPVLAAAPCSAPRSSAGSTCPGWPPARSGRPTRLTEPEGGTGATSTPRPSEGGEYYVLNGHKWLITLSSPATPS